MSNVRLAAARGSQGHAAPLRGRMVARRAASDAPVPSNVLKHSASAWEEEDAMFLATPLPKLMAAASVLRDRAFGNVITFSPKVSLLCDKDE